MATPTEAEAAESIGLVDPRAQLAEWASANDEWVRLLVAEVIATGRPLGASVVERAYLLFRQEKALDARELPAVALLDIEARQDESAPPLSLIRLSEVRGVNALVAGAVIEPHEGLTILYGENGTGKTGYSRIFKALANSRTADTILGNIDVDSSEVQTAKVEFKLGEDAQALTWTGDLGVSPFTRMSIFDSPAVRTHVDEDLDYVYTPASLALFNDVTTAIQAVTAQIDAAISELASSGSGLLSRFQRGSTIYPLIEILGASTDLADLKARSKSGDEVDQQLDALTQGVAALRANTMGAQIAGLKSEQRVLSEAATTAAALADFEQVKYNQALATRAQLTTDYQTFRHELFAAADLPADPDNSWNDFIEAGETYRQHLVHVGAHDAGRCLYCRQPLLDPARELLTRYSTYLEYKISADIRTTDTALNGYKRQAAALQGNEMASFIQQYKDADPSERPRYFVHVEAIADARSAVSTAVAAGQPVSIQTADLVAAPRADVDTALTTVGHSISDLETLQKGRTEALAEKQAELLELKDAVELGKSWSLIETHVKSAKEADRLKTLKRPLPGLGRSVTALAKTASDQLINRSFDALFLRRSGVKPRSPSNQGSFPAYCSTGRRQPGHRLHSRHPVRHDAPHTVREVQAVRLLSDH